MAVGIVCAPALKIKPDGFEELRVHFGWSYSVAEKVV